MNGLQKAGGVAALIEAIAYVSGFAIFMLFLDSSGYVGPVQKVAFLVENQTTLYLGILVTYVLTGTSLVVLAGALHERLKIGTPALMQIATVFGLIWAGLIIASGMVAIVGIETVVDLYDMEPDRAGSVWLAIATVHDGLGGGIELVGGLWVLLISSAALRSGGLPKALNYLGLLIGITGILTVIPPLNALIDLFGLAQILWFASLGIVMYRDGQRDLGLRP